MRPSIVSFGIKKRGLHDSVLAPMNSDVRNCRQSIVLPTVGPPRICTLTGGLASELPVVTLRAPGGWRLEGGRAAAAAGGRTSCGRGRGGDVLAATAVELELGGPTEVLLVCRLSP